MSIKSPDRRSLLALGAAVALAPAAQAAPPGQAQASCQGQPEITPLEPLEIVTAKGRTRFFVEFADSPRERELGLMCRRSLAPDRGMLFDFATPQRLAFWMRNTLIPLDIIYLRPDGRVLSMVRNARPLDETPLPSNGAARAVLEIAGGRAAELGLLPGDRVRHRIFADG